MDIRKNDMLNRRRSGARRFYCGYPYRFNIIKSVASFKNNRGDESFVGLAVVANRGGDESVRASHFPLAPTPVSAVVANWGGDESVRSEPFPPGSHPDQRRRGDQGGDESVRSNRGGDKSVRSNRGGDENITVGTSVSCRPGRCGEPGWGRECAKRAISPWLPPRSAPPRRPGWGREAPPRRTGWGRECAKRPGWGRECAQRPGWGREYDGGYENIAVGTRI